MSHVFPVEPSGGWYAGDLAYCVNAQLPPDGTSEPRLERGRIYRVVAAEKPSNVVHYGLKLQGVSTGEAWGFWSNRFIRVGPVGGRLHRIALATEYTMAHYWPTITPKDRITERLGGRR